MKKNKLTLIIIIAIVIAIILKITFIKTQKIANEQTINCIADKSKIITSVNCSHCINQKKILGDYYDKFELLDVTENPALWNDYNIIGVPTWVIEEKIYPGVKSISELKELAGC